VTSFGEPKKGVIRACLIASAVLHADIALGADVEPSLKPILEGHGRHVEVISQAFKTEVAIFVHPTNIDGISTVL